jgi:hypothetical protein
MNIRHNKVQYVSNKAAYQKYKWIGKRNSDDDVVKNKFSNVHKWLETTPTMYTEVRNTGNNEYKTMVKPKEKN